MPVVPDKIRPNGSALAYAFADRPVFATHVIQMALTPDGRRVAAHLRDAQDDRRRRRRVADGRMDR